MNNTILLIEENPDDQFLIKRALNKRFLNQSHLVGMWSKPTEDTASCISSVNNVELSYPPASAVCQQDELVVSVEVAKNKEEAVDYLKRKKNDSDRERYLLPVLIIINVAMPYISGLSLLAWIKRQSELIHIPIVMVSDVDKKVQAMNLGANAYIFKTLCYSGLTEVVRTLLLSKSPTSQELYQRDKMCSEQLLALATSSKNTLSEKPQLSSKKNWKAGSLIRKFRLIPLM
ncbi:MAG: response regulator [Cyanobacteriota bacterium]